MSPVSSSGMPINADGSEPECAADEHKGCWRRRLPVFQQAGTLTDLVATLLTQHKAGHALTAEMLRLPKTDAFQDVVPQGQVITACRGERRGQQPAGCRQPCATLSLYVSEHCCMRSDPCRETTRPRP